MKRKNLEQDSCPIARSLSTIGEWWSLLILRDVFLGKRRFSELEKSLGLAKNVLSSRLQKLVSEGVLEIVPASDGSAYQEYSLTEKERNLSHTRSHSPMGREIPFPRRPHRPSACGEKIRKEN